MERRRKILPDVFCGRIYNGRHRQQTEGPIRIDVANAGRLRNRLEYSVMWVALDEEGNEIPETSAYPRVTKDYDS